MLSRVVLSKTRTYENYQTQILLLPMEQFLLKGTSKINTGTTTMTSFTSQLWETLRIVFCKLCQQGDLVSFVGRVQTDESVKGNGIKTYFTKTVIEKWNLLAKSAYNKEQKPTTMTTEKTTNIEKRTEEFVQPVEENIPEFPPDAFEDFNPSGFYNPHLN